MTVFETDRLRARPFAEADAPFVLDLVTQPSWLANIGDRGVHSLDDARAYIRDRLRPSYATTGFGFWAIDDRGGVPMGLCGIIHRPALDAPDLGYAFLPSFWGHGFAREAAAETVRLARDRYHLDRLVAIVSPGNAPSIRVLNAVEMQFERTLTLPGEDEAVSLYGRALDSSRR